MTAISKRQRQAISRAYTDQRNADAVAVKHPLNDEQIRDLSLAFRLAFSAMIGGSADELQWSTCVCSLDIALILAENGIGKGHIPAINEALEGAFRAKIRHSKIGVWGFDGAAIQAIKDAYIIHEAQIEMATKEEMRDAIHEVRRRIDAGNVFKVIDAKQSIM